MSLFRADTRIIVHKDARRISRLRIHPKIVENKLLPRRDVVIVDRVDADDRFDRGFLVNVVFPAVEGDLDHVVAVLGDLFDIIPLVGFTRKIGLPVVGLFVLHRHGKAHRHVIRTVLVGDEVRIVRIKIIIFVIVIFFGDDGNETSTLEYDLVHLRDRRIDNESRRHRFGIVVVDVIAGKGRRRFVRAGVRTLVAFVRNGDPGRQLSLDLYLLFRAVVRHFRPVEMDGGHIVICFFDDEFRFHRVDRRIVYGVIHRKDRRRLVRARVHVFIISVRDVDAARQSPFHLDGLFGAVVHDRLVLKGQSRYVDGRLANV